MNTRRRALLVVAVILCDSSPAAESSPPPPAVQVTVLEQLRDIPDGLPFADRLAHGYTDLPTRQIQPQGWIEEHLDRQRSGLTGHPEQSGFPFNTDMWADGMDVRDREHAAHGSDWWPYEQTAYYLDGALRVAYLTGDEGLLRRIRANIAYVLEHRRENGSLVPAILGSDTPIMPIFLRMILEEYENTRDPNQLKAMERHYAAFYGNEVSFEQLPHTTFADQTILSVELLCRLAEETGNRAYIQIAEKLYLTFCRTHSDDVKGFEKMRTQLTRRQPAHGHAVVYHEFLKLPAILYVHTGKPDYRNAVVNAIAALHRDRTSGCFLQVRRRYRSGDRLDIEFETAPVVRLHEHPAVESEGAGISVHYGPLLFSLPVDAKAMLVTDDGGVGKCSPDFPMYCLEPRSAWNVALPKTLLGNEIRVERREVIGYPWNVGNHPVSLKVEGARRVKNWKLDRHVRVPGIPNQLELDPHDHPVVLVPMGSTLLRMSVFAAHTET